MRVRPLSWPLLSFRSRCRARPLRQPLARRRCFLAGLMLECYDMYSKETFLSAKQAIGLGLFRRLFLLEI